MLLKNFQDKLSYFAKPNEATVLAPHMHLNMIKDDHVSKEICKLKVRLRQCKGNQKPLCTCIYLLLKYPSRMEFPGEMCSMILKINWLCT